MSLWEKIKVNWPLFAILFVSVAVLVGVFLFRGDESNVTEIDKRESVTVAMGGEKITVFRSGRVVRTLADGTEVEEFWSSEKTAAFFAYYYETYGQSMEVPNITVGEGGLPVDDRDELSEVIFDDSPGSGGGGGTGGLDDYFNTPSPTTPGSGGSGGSGGDGSGGGSAGEPECLFWRLSYCVTFPTPTPAVPTPMPEDVVFFEPTCEDIRNRETGKTVIGDELCVGEFEQ